MKRRSPCPISCTLDLLGDRWTLLVLRDLFAGKSSYKELLHSPEGIATNILSDRLLRLSQNGLVEKVRSGREAFYSLSERGRSLLPVLQAVGQWGLQNLEGTQAHIKIPSVHPVAAEPVATSSPTSDLSGCSLTRSPGLE